MNLKEVKTNLIITYYKDRSNLILEVIQEALVLFSNQIHKVFKELRKRIFMQIKIIYKH
jgi:hypothetical protein